MLSDRYIKSLKAKDQRYYSTRERGLCIRVEPSGVKNWYYIYKLDGKRTCYKIGEYTSTTGLAWARIRIEPLRAVVQQGKCAKAYEEEQARAQKLEQSQRMTFSLLLAMFKEMELPRRQIKTAAEKLRILHRDFLPQWHDTELRAIKATQVHIALDAIKGESARRHAHTHVNDLFKYAVSRELMSTNPAANIRTPAPKKRTRFLSHDEIRYFWLNIDNAKLSPTRDMNPQVKRVLKLLLLTGQRRSEIVEATTGQIKGDWLEIENTKNRQPQQVYLSSMAKGLLHSESPGPVFSIHPDTVTRQLGQWVRYTGQKPYTVHDLRRTVGTELGRLGVKRFDADKILNHVDHSIGGTYDRYAYDKERRAGLKKWENELFRIAGAAGKSNVVQGSF